MRYNYYMSKIEDYKIGMIVYGRISGIKPYGAFVSFDGNVSGLIHISELSNGYVKDVNKFVRINDHVMLKVIDIDYEHSQLRLSFKAMSQNKRKYLKKVKAVSMPDKKIGFSSIEKMMPIWKKEREND